MKIDVMALLDSGADISVIPKGLAEFLDLDLSGVRETANGIGGEVSVIATNIIVYVEKGHESYNFKIPVQVVLEDKDDVPVILGRTGFFDKFIIYFNQQEEKIRLKRL